MLQICFYKMHITICYKYVNHTAIKRELSLGEDAVPYSRPTLETKLCFSETQTVLIIEGDTTRILEALPCAENPFNNRSIMSKFY